MREVGDEIARLDKELKEINDELEHIMLSIPNIPHESVPIGEDEEENVEIRNGEPCHHFHMNRNRIGI
jgi:seryl-tRNA synthetase